MITFCNKLVYKWVQFFLLKRIQYFLIGPHEKKRPPTYEDFEPKFPKSHEKKGLLHIGILNQISWKKRPPTYWDFEPKKASYIWSHEKKASYIWGFWTKSHEKKASYIWGFWTKIPKISNFKSIFKPIRKFSRLTPNIKKITLGALKVCQVSRNLRNIFCSSFIIHHHHHHY